jgi:hypothetical protein
MSLRSRRRTIALALATVLTVAAAGLSACSDDNGNQRKLLSRASAAELRQSLDAVEQEVDSGDCVGAANQAAALRQQVDALPSRVAGKLRRVLADGADRLQTLVGKDCEPTGATAPAAAPEEQPEEEKPGKGKGKAKGKAKKEEELTAPENPPEGTTDEGNPQDGDQQPDGGVGTAPDTGTTP